MVVLAPHAASDTYVQLSDIGADTISAPRYGFPFIVKRMSTLNGFCAFVRFRKEVKAKELDWSKIKYIDDGFSMTELVKARMPKKERDELEVVACCFRKPEVCQQERALMGGCQRRETAFTERRNARAAAGGPHPDAETRRAAKEVERAERKRKRVVEGGKTQARALEMYKRPCKAFLVGTCKRHGSGHGGVCKRPHEGLDENGVDRSYSNVHCGLDPCPDPTTCPYQPPHGGSSSA